MYDVIGRKEIMIVNSGKKDEYNKMVAVLFIKANM